MRYFASAVALAALTLSTSVFAQELDVGANVHILQGETGSTVVTAEYDWQLGNLGGFGFVDKNVDGTGYFTNHEVRLDVHGPVYALAEVGGSPAWDFQLVGVGVKLRNLPVVRDNFVFLNVTAELARGANANQFKIVWRTRDLKLTEDVSVYSSGFARFRIDAPDVIQPQVWVKIKDIPVEFGSEIAVFGDTVNVQVAVKVNF